MVLDLDLFRDFKGYNPDKVRENQKLRFKDVGLVEKVIAMDTEWRNRRHNADNFNKLKNICSKEIGEKMKKKENPGDENATVSDDIVNNLQGLTAEKLKSLTVVEIKKIRVLIDEAIKSNDLELVRCESERNSALREIGKFLIQICIDFFFQIIRD